MKYRANQKRTAARRIGRRHPHSQSGDYVPVSYRGSIRRCPLCVGAGDHFCPWCGGTHVNAPSSDNTAVSDFRRLHRSNIR
jgi:hypothetical protein